MEEGLEERVKLSLEMGGGSMKVRFGLVWGLKGLDEG